ncbi:MAG: GTPase HflX [Candidatus Omnitrophica bacterium CG23_combo_of_CG06-09_8_20_14_all_40_11]|nr:MAG: GTPase HflX [Candidatus Omnitrophica bacterium CG23_combo_of_CG06-09_8_20_14_all_40_11]
MERALLVTIKLKSEKDNWRLEDVAEELEELIHTCGAEVVDNITCICDKPTPNFFIGRGKTQEIALLSQEQGADTVIFSHDLSGTQQRNLEEVIGKKTIDRTQLILDIFARHARSPEGKTQVELAQSQYLMPRLVGKGIMLSRLGGGIGTRGPGEQKLEVDRRRISKRIDKLKDDLKHLKAHRLTMRKKRKENAIPSVALIGYTNAGKSTLLNALTDAGQTVSDSLFTTLDPIHKSFVLPDGEHIVISDTVGFLHNLPHHLIEAFKATLEEAVEADLLIHVLDISHPRVYEYNQAVFSVLKELQADQKPMITALNKIDLLEDKTWLEKLKKDFRNSLVISAKLRQNLDSLLKKIQENFASRMTRFELLIPHSRMDLVDLCYREGKVEEIKYLQKGIKIKLNLPTVLSQKLLHNKDIKKLN